MGAHIHADAEDRNFGPELVLLKSDEAVATLLPQIEVAYKTAIDVLSTMVRASSWSWVTRTVVMLRCNARNPPACSVQTLVELALIQLWPGRAIAAVTVGPPIISCAIAIAILLH
jgi:hypothetical protein